MIMIIGCIIILNIEVQLHEHKANVISHRRYVSHINLSIPIGS